MGRPKGSKNKKTLQRIEPKKVHSDLGLTASGKKRYASHYKPTGNPVGGPLIYDDETLAELREELLEFCHRPEVWHISAFNIHKGMSCKWLQSIAARHPQFEEAIEDAKRILGNKIIKIAVDMKKIEKLIDIFLANYLGERPRILAEKREEAMMQAEVLRESMMREPSHPFWVTFADYMKTQEAPVEISAKP